MHEHDRQHTEDVIESIAGQVNPEIEHRVLNDVNEKVKTLDHSKNSTIKFGFA